MKKRSLAETRAKVMVGCEPRITKSESSPGRKQLSRRRISKPPPRGGGGVPVLMVTLLPAIAVTVSEARLGKYVGETGAGNHASAGTVALVLMARSSAHSLAKRMV